MTSKRIRLDQLLVEQYGYESRSRARDAILRGCVNVDDKVILKQGQKVLADSKVLITDEAAPYVSRAALKLKSALERTEFKPHGHIALDLGASTGGFTQVLLEQGATKVWCIDVGTAQLHESLLGHPKIVNLENLNARDLSLEDLKNERPSFLVSDLSFISLKLALPPALDIAASGAYGIFLVKPQFEVGKENIGKGGIVRNLDYAKDTARAIAHWLDNQDDWSVTHFMPSPIEGGDGNSEYLMAARKK
ncbi:MAG: TlyA family RNA methyltransferase [Rhizobiales bacterium]|nr:TlyA family RNA methyltransferase [Hyphomicrobiales bacterium]